MPSDRSRRSQRADRRGGRLPRPGRPGAGRAPGGTDPLIGHTVGGHKILQRAGSDAICTTYKANHAAMARLVAFKALRPDAAADPATLARFYDTAKAAAQVHHPNILSIYDVSTAQDVHFCTMEYVEGRSVGELLRARQKIASDDAVRVAIDVGEALRFANAKGMPGFRLSADRVVLSSQGAVKILPPTLTEPGAAVLDDAYALRAVGILLYAMLSGGRLDDLESALDPGVPAPALDPIKKAAIGTRKAIADVVDRMVACPGTAPYASVQAALADLRHVLQKQEVAETRTRTATERAQERKRHGLILAGVAVGVFAGFILLVFILLASRRAQRRRVLGEYAEAQRQANAAIEQGKELWKQFWADPADARRDQTLAAYRQATVPYRDFIARHRNAPEAQEAQHMVAGIEKAIGDLQVKAADRVQYLKELNAYMAVRKAFDADVARRLETGGAIDETAWRQRYAALLGRYPDSPWIRQRVDRVLRNLKPEIQRAEMKIEVNKLINDFREVHRPKHQYGKALAAWEKFRDKYDKIDHVRKDALTNAQTQTDMIKRDARVQCAQMMNRANYLAKQKKDSARAREIYTTIADNFGIKRHVEQAKAALRKLPE